MSLFRTIFTASIAVGVATAATAFGSSAQGAAEFRQYIRPLLENYCFDCHADGANKGGVSFDEFKSDAAALTDHDLWWQVLKNLRAGLMPPQKKSQPTAAEKQRLETWIKKSVFAADPKNPDPGRVTIRRLNRIEYRNTIRDLLGVDFDTATVFPPDDTGHGFDNIGDVLTLPPMLLEKYVAAANQIIAEAVPTVSRTVRERVVWGREFRVGPGAGEISERPRRSGGLQLSYYQPARAANTFKATLAGKYQLTVALLINERYVDGVVDLNKCRLTFRVDGKELLRNEYAWEGGKPHTYNFEVDWAAGNHELAFELEPLTPDEPQTRSLALQISSVKISGPLAKEHWVQPKNYAKFFPKPVPPDEAGKRAYAHELLRDFARRAFRRPADEKTLERLVKLAEGIYRQPGETFEAGVAQAMVAVLASPRFLFREEQAETASGGYPYVDEYALASRLSYFLWSSLPDETLLRLAERGELRRNLSAQVQRLLKDERSGAFVRNFVGQWLRARDIEGVAIEARSVLAREKGFDPKVRPLRAELTPELRLAMRLETEKSFDYVLREDRSLLELLDADYTFLNERLAAHYGIPGVSGPELRLVKLPADSPRGGILTQGTMLGVTSNPTRTSPVKRGVFVLENVLGTPPPPPPVNVPPLENAAKGATNRTPSLRETLALHRENVLCASCHNRMDPIGLAFENFNAMGMWREAELGEPVDTTGTLITGEHFKDVRELKRILVQNHARDFYHTVTEKLLTYALGRGLEYYDVETCDQIEARLAAANGRPSALIAGVVESAAFQRMRRNEPAKPAEPAGRDRAIKSNQQRAEVRLKP